LCKTGPDAQRQALERTRTIVGEPRVALARLLQGSLRRRQNEGVEGRIAGLDRIQEGLRQLG
jgi:hypothetical protein